MKYDENLINITDKLCESNTMYSLILLDAKSLNLTLSGFRCFLDGKYIVCLNIADTLAVHSGYYEAINLRFQPYFYNVNLSHDVIGMEFYTEMREKYGYPDFRLFRMRDNNYFGIIHISDEEYNTASLYFAQTKRDIETHTQDVLWSCRARSDIISVLHIAEGAYLGKQSGLENEILRYIHDNINAEITLETLCSRFNTNRTTISALIKEKTGLPPMKYVLEVRLNQSRPDLLFTQLPINEIASKYGFSDSNYYIRVFKKRFGKSPLQFRKDGWAERLRDEGIYHRRAEMEKTEMTVKEFSDYFKKGLGRAIIRLKKQTDKEPYKKVFSEFLLGKKHKMNREFGIYEKEILDIFDDKDYTDEIVERLMTEFKSTEGHLYYNSLPLLLLLGYRNQAEEILESRYKTAYKELLEYTKKPWDGEKYPTFARVYMSTCGALARRIKVGDERIKQMLFDIADLYNYCEYPVIPTYQNPMFGIWDGVGRDHFFVILDEVIKEHKNGHRLDIRNEMVAVYYEDKENDVYIPTAQEILNADEANPETFKYYNGFLKAPEETVLAVANAIIDEKTDMVRKKYLLKYFAHTLTPNESPVNFPLEPKKLIKIAEDKLKITSKIIAFDVIWDIFVVLRYTRHPDVHDFAMKLYFDNNMIFENSQTERWYRGIILEMRFGKNYIPEIDKSDFVALLRSQSESDKHKAIGIFMENLSNKAEGLPLDLIPYIFANITHCHERQEFCEVLLKSNLMTQEMREECLFDSNLKTRELVLKTKKPRKSERIYFMRPPEMP